MSASSHFIAGALSGAATPDDFSEENRPIAEALSSGIAELAALVDHLDEESSRRASYFALAPVRYGDTEKAVRDALARLVPSPEAESELKGLTTEIEQAAGARDWERWNRLMERKIVLKAKKVTAKGDE